MIKKFIISLLFVLILSACTQNSSKVNENNQFNSLVNKTLKYELVSITDDIIKLIEQKDYISSYEELINFHKKANEVGLYSLVDEDVNTKDFKDTFNTLSNSIKIESDNQKYKEVNFDIQAKESTQQDPEKNENTDLQGDKKDTGMEKNQEDESEETEIENNTSNINNKNTEDEADITIPEELLLKKYPDLVISDHDLGILNQVSELYNYCSYVISQESTDKKAGLIKLKYYFYKIKYLAHLTRYEEINKYYESMVEQWQLESVNAHKTSEKDAKILDSISTNLKLQIDAKQTQVIDMTTKIAIESIDELMAKTKED